MTNFANHPFIRAACIEIAYDNGMINRNVLEEDWLQETEELLIRKFDTATRDIAEGQLKRMDEETFSEFCTGEQDEELSAAVPQASAVLQAAFEGE